MMRITTKEEILELCLKKLNDLNFNLLIYNKEVFSNPYSLIHPGYLYYIWGNLIGSKDRFEKASEIYDSLIKGALDLHSYLDAGEFSISKMKAEGQRDSNSKELKKSYKKAVKIFNSLVELGNDPFFIDALIEVEELFEKFSKIKIKKGKIEALYRKASYRYLAEAESIKIDDLINIKIMSYFKAVKYLNKIQKTSTGLDEIEKESILNKLIYEISNQLDKLKENKLVLGGFSKYVLRVNLEYGLGRAHYLLKQTRECKLFFLKCLRDIEFIFKESDLTRSLLKSKETFYKDGNIHKIQSLEIFSRELFEKVVVINEKIELLELKSRVISDLGEISDKSEFGVFKPEEISHNLINLYLNLIDLYEKEISNQTIKKQLIESISEKYKAFCVFYSYQIIKKLDFLEENLIQRS